MRSCRYCETREERFMAFTIYKGQPLVEGCCDSETCREKAKTRLRERIAEIEAKAEMMKHQLLK